MSARKTLAAREVLYDRTAPYVQVARRERARALAELLARISAPLRNWLSRRRTENTLRELDDRTLADVGLTRDDIRQIARGHYIVDRAAELGPHAPAAPANAPRAGDRAA